MVLALRKAAQPTVFAGQSKPMSRGGPWWSVNHGPGKSETWQRLAGVFGVAVRVRGKNYAHMRARTYARMRTREQVFFYFALRTTDQKN